MLHCHVCFVLTTHLGRSKTGIMRFKTAHTGRILGKMCDGAFVSDCECVCVCVREIRTSGLDCTNTGKAHIRCSRRRTGEKKYILDEYRNVVLY